MNYIDKWFHFYNSTESFNVHKNQGLINPDSICFLKETGQIYTQGVFFGICSKELDQMMLILQEHEAKLRNIFGTEGASVGDGIINNFADLVNFLDGFTDQDNLKEVLDNIKTVLEAQMRDLQSEVTDRLNAMESQIQIDTDKLNQTIALVNDQLENFGTRLDSYSVTITTLTSSLESHIREYNQLKNSYDIFKTYTEARLDSLGNNITAVNSSILTLQQAFDELDKKFDSVEDEVAGIEEMFDEAKRLVSELEDRFESTLTDLVKFEANVNKEIQGIKDSIGEPDGIAPLDSGGTIPSRYLPSYVDDVVEYGTKAAFPLNGEEGKIYVAKDTNLTYRWSGSQYVEISPSIGLGETAQTAYPGNKGKKNADDIAELGSTVQSQEQRLTNIEKSPFKKLTTEEIEAYTPENAGEIVYNTETNKYQYWNGTEWTDIGAGGESESGATNNIWIAFTYDTDIPQVGSVSKVTYPLSPTEAELNKYIERLEATSDYREANPILQEMIAGKDIIKRLCPICTEEVVVATVEAPCSINIDPDGTIILYWILNHSSKEYYIAEKLGYKKSTAENPLGYLTLSCFKSVDLAPSQGVIKLTNDEELESGSVAINHGDLAYNESDSTFIFIGKNDRLVQVAEAHHWELIFYIPDLTDDPFNGDPIVGMTQRVLFPDFQFDENGYEFSKHENAFHDIPDYKDILVGMMDGYRTFSLTWQLSESNVIYAPCTMTLSYNNPEWPIITWMCGSKFVTAELQYVLYENPIETALGTMNGYLQLQVTKIIDLNNNEINWIHV